MGNIPGGGGYVPWLPGKTTVKQTESDPTDTGYSGSTGNAPLVPPHGDYGRNDSTIGVGPPLDPRTDFGDPTDIGSPWPSGGPGTPGWGMPPDTPSFFPEYNRSTGYLSRAVYTVFPSRFDPYQKIRWRKKYY